jgi:hypothetical protein
MSDISICNSHFWFLFLETLNEQNEPSGTMTVKGLSPDFDACIEKALDLQKLFPTRWVGMYQERKKGFFPPAPPVEDMDILIWTLDEEIVFVGPMVGLEQDQPS